MYPALNLREIQTPLGEHRVCNVSETQGKIASRRVARWYDNIEIYPRDHCYVHHSQKSLPVPSTHWCTVPDRSPRAVSACKKTKTMADPALHTEYMVQPHLSRTADWQAVLLGRMEIDDPVGVVRSRHLAMRKAVAFWG